MYWVPLLAFEVLLLGLALYKGYDCYKTYRLETMEGGSGRLAMLLVRDSVLYFTMWVLNLPKPSFQQLTLDYKVYLWLSWWTSLYGSLVEWVLIFPSWFISHAPHLLIDQLHWNSHWICHHDGKHYEPTDALSAERKIRWLRKRELPLWIVEVRGSRIEHFNSACYRPKGYRAHYISLDA